MSISPLKLGTIPPPPLTISSIPSIPAFGSAVVLGNSELTPTTTDAFQAPVVENLTILASQTILERLPREQQEFDRIRGYLSICGMRACVKGSPLPALVAGDKIVTGACSLYSDYWGAINLMRLNQGISAYQGPAGLPELARDLCFLDGRIQLEMDKLPQAIAHARKQPLKELWQDLKWRHLCTDWRQALLFTRLFAEAHVHTSYQGMSGYDRFADTYFEGDTVKTFLTVHALLPEPDFAELGWEQLKKVTLYGSRPLHKVLISEEYHGTPGQERFSARFFKGERFKAFEAARDALSDEELAHLEWETCKPPPKDQDSIFRQALESSHYLGQGGYDRFALEYFDGNSAKAYRAAKSLLSAPQFQSLDWGKQKQTNVREQKALTATLQQGLYRGHLGRIRFLIDHYQELTPYKGPIDFKKIGTTFRKCYRIAQSLFDVKSPAWRDLDWKPSDVLTKDELIAIKAQIEQDTPEKPVTSKPPLQA